MADGRHLEIKDKLLYSSNCLTDFGEIWYDDAYQAFLSEGRPKIQKFKNSRWRTAAMLKIEKSRYLRNRLADFDEICISMHISQPEQRRQI